MYDTLIMLKSDASFTIDELYQLVVDVMGSGSESVERQARRRAFW
jgi:hypothetical protein